MLAKRENDSRFISAFEEYLNSPKGDSDQIRMVELSDRCLSKAADLGDATGFAKLMQLIFGLTYGKNVYASREDADASNTKGPVLVLMPGAMTRDEWKAKHVKPNGTVVVEQVPE